VTDADKPAFAQVLAHLHVALGGSVPDVVLAHVYFRALMDREIEFIVMAAEQLMLNAKWFPKTSEWRAAAVKVEADRLEAQRKLLRESPTRLCVECEDSGWAADISGRVHRCACQRLRRLELLGRRPWPALPAVASDKSDDVSHAEAAEMKVQIELRTGRIITPRSMPKAPFGTSDDDVSSGDC
jgi:hypothetical protein